MFMGIIAGKPSRDFTCPLGMPKGLKGLFIYAKCNRFFHDSELMFIVFNVLHFYFAKGLAKCKFGGI
jgi:hypothetical protein